MEEARFDRLVRAVADRTSRRGLIGLLSAVPIVGGLTGVLSPQDAGAKDRRRRRKQRHKRRKNRGKRKKGCTPKSHARVCAGKCGPVKSRQTCGKAVDCGSCDCSPSCGECFTCQGATGTCVPATAGTPCGDAATCADGVLQPRSRCNGRGVCEAAEPVSCAPYAQCAGDACATTCAGAGDCVDGSFCDEGKCVGDLPNGGVCALAGQCQSGFCVDGVCCNSACDAACHSCAIPGSEGTCTTEDNLTPCGGDNFCCSGTCQECCGNVQCTSTGAPICDEGTCIPCSMSSQCGAGKVCCGGSCFAGICCDAAACAPGGNECGNHQCSCGGGSACSGDTPDCCGDPGGCTNINIDPANCGACGAPACDASVPVCWNGNCVCGDVCASGCQFTTLQAAVEGLPAGSTIRLCAETYGNAIFRQSMTVIGKGAANTTLRGVAGPVVHVVPGVTVTLEGVLITNGAAISGGGVNNNGFLTMNDCVVTGNSAGNAGGAGGIFNDPSATLTMTNCTVSYNTVGKSAGGISSFGALTMTNCDIHHNEAGEVCGGLVVASGTATLNGTQVHDNTAGYAPAGIDCRPGATVNLNDESAVYDNAPGNCGGGGIFNGDGCDD